ncbi:MAG: hypothetical protein HUJ73_07180 [Eubacterium sp.]|nr:hypothetical protein [Eubacterium sp.]
MLNRKYGSKNRKEIGGFLEKLYPGKPRQEQEVLAWIDQEEIDFSRKPRKRRKSNTGKYVRKTFVKGNEIFQTCRGTAASLYKNRDKLKAIVRQIKDLI